MFIILTDLTRFLLSFVCSHDYSYCYGCIFIFLLVFVPSNAFGMIWMIVRLMLFENRNFYAQCLNFYNSLERDKLLKKIQSIGIKIFYVVLIFQNCCSYRSMICIHIITDCYVLDRFCFYCIVCLF
jgi:hypothetical protein